jgi:hypothetical protein
MPMPPELERFQATFVPLKIEYWRRFTTDGQAAADQWDAQEYQPLRAIRDQYMSDPEYGPTVQELQRQAVAIHTAYDALRQAKEAWWLAQRNGTPAPDGTAANEARAKLQQVSPAEEPLWRAGAKWALDREQEALLAQAQAAATVAVQADVAYIEKLLDGTGYSLDDLGDPSQWERGVPGVLSLGAPLIMGGINFSQLITDDAFCDQTTMTEDEIRAFINRFPGNVVKNPQLPVWEYAEDNATKRNSGRTVDIAHLIAACSRIFRLNPRLLLTKMQKESVLLSGMWQGEQIGPDWKMMILGMGFGVYTGTQQTADFHWSGIDRQIVLAAFLSRFYFNNQSQKYPTPQTYPALFPAAECQVPVFNRATWVLFRYTPHTITSEGQGNITFVRVWDDFFGTQTRLPA